MMQTEVSAVYIYVHTVQINAAYTRHNIMNWAFSFHRLNLFFKKFFYILFLLLLLLSLFAVYSHSYGIQWHGKMNFLITSFVAYVKVEFECEMDSIFFGIMALLLGIHDDMWLWNMTWDVIEFFFWGIRWSFCHFDKLLNFEIFTFWLKVVSSNLIQNSTFLKHNP